MAGKARKLEQISVFLENRAGVVADLCAALTEQRIDIQALTVLDTIDIGTVRMIVNDPEKAKEALQNSGAAYMVVPVIGLEIENVPGSFAAVAKTMANNGVNIEYIYATATPGTDRCLGIFRVDDADKAITLDYA